MNNAGVKKLAVFNDPILDRQIEELVFHGKAGWRDEKGALSSAKPGGTSPTWTTFQGGISRWSFGPSTSAEELNVDFHIQHDYVPGSLVYPHIHWQNNGVNTGVVRWGVEFSVAKGHGQEAFNGTTTVYLEQAADGTHQVTEFSDAQAFNTSIEPDSVVCVRVFRDGAHANDTCSDSVFGLFVDLHYMAYRLATPNKAPSFYDL